MRVATVCQGEQVLVNFPKPVNCMSLRFINALAEKMMKKTAAYHILFCIKTFALSACSWL